MESWGFHRSTAAGRSATPRDSACVTSASARPWESLTLLQVGRLQVQTRVLATPTPPLCGRQGCDTVSRLHDRRLGEGEVVMPAFSHPWP